MACAKRLSHHLLLVVTKKQRFKEFEFRMFVVSPCRMKIRASIYVAFTMLLSPQLAMFADEAEQEIEEVSITASRLPITDVRAETITDEEIGSATQIVDVITQMPSYAVSRSGGYGTLTQIRVRGAEANHTKVLIDGVSVNELDSGFNFGVLNSAGIRRVEAFNGPLSSVWGSDALAGVVAFSTTPTETGSHLLVNMGPLGNRDVAADIARINDNSFVAGTAAISQSDGFNISSQGDEKDGFKQKVINLTGGQKFQTFHYDASLRLNRSSIDYDPIPRDGDRSNDISRISIGTCVAWDSSDVWKPSLKLSYLSSELVNFADGVETNDYVYDDLRLSLASTFLLPDGMNFNAYIENQEKRFEQHGRPSFFGDPNQSQSLTTQSAGLEVQKLFKAMELRASIRGESSSEFQDSFGWNAYLGRSFQSHVAYLAAGVGYRHPSFIDRFGYTPDTFIGNPNLDSEKVEQVEAGWVQQMDSWKFRTAIFHSTLTNEINGFVYDPVAFAFTSANVDGESKRRGLELLVRRSFSIGTIHANVSYIDSVEENLQEIRRPNQLGWIEFRTKDWRGYRGRFALSYNGSQFDNDFSTFPAKRVRLDGYSLLHITVSKQVSNSLNLSIRSENLLNVQYENVIGFNAPPRQLFFSISIKS